MVVVDGSSLFDGGWMRHKISFELAAIRLFNPSVNGR